MPEEFIPFPVRGLSENFAFGLQEPGTTRDTRNMRALNPRNGRIMGAQRSGLTNYASTLVSVTNEKVQDLNVLGYDSRAITWEVLENDIAFPEDFTTNYWTTAGGMVITENNTNAPDGSLTADLLADTNAAARAIIYRDFSEAANNLEDGQRYWASIHTRLNTSTASPPRAFLALIQNGSNRSELYLEGSAIPPLLYFRSNESDTIRLATNGDPVYIEDVGSLFYRIGVAYDWIVNPTFGTNLRWEFHPIQNTVGDTGSAWAWGAQFEVGQEIGEYTYNQKLELKSKSDAVNVQCDQFGNIYVLDAKANITKYSSDLKEIWRIPLPLVDQRHQVRALHVDQFGCVYAGVSEGGRQDRASIWKFIQLPNARYELWWRIETGQYVEEIKTFQDFLYTAQNDSDDKKARIAVYEQIFSRNPQLAWETGDVPVPHPIRGMDLNSVGDVLVACDEPVGAISGNNYRLIAGTRGAPLAFYPTAEDASLEEMLHPTGDETLTAAYLAFQANVRPWAIYRAADITTNDVEGDLEEGAKILRWRDSSGNERHIEADPDNEAPTISFNGPGGLPTVRFNGSNQAFRSGINGGSARANRDQQRTVLPGYENCMWLMCMMARPEAASNQTCILSQQNTSTNAFEFAFWANRDEGSNVSSPVYGQLSVYDDTTNSLSQANGTDSHPLSGSFTNALNNAVIVTYLNNGNLTSPGSTWASFRLNGENIDNAYFSADFITSNARTYVGRDSAGTYFYKGDLSEIIVLYGADVTSWVDGLDEGDTDTYPLIDSTPNTNGTVDGGHGLEQLEGFVAHRYGMYTLLPGGAAETNQHSYGLDSNDFAFGPPGITTVDVSNTVIRPNSAIGQSYLKFPFVAKISSENGAFQWLVNENTTNATTSNAGGVGYGVVVDSEDNVLCIGPDASATNANNAVRKIADNGSTAAVSGSNTWTVGWSGNFPQYKTPRLAVDHSNNLYVPVFQSNLNQQVRIYNGSNGATLYAFEIPELVESYAICVDPNVPEYDGDLDPEVAQHIFVGTEMDTLNRSVFRVPLVKDSLVNTSPRVFKLMAVSSGRIIDITDSSSFSTPAGSVGSLDVSPRYVQSAVLFERLYYTDGKRVVFYDPRDDKVSKLEASIGFVPRRAKLIESWRGRLVLGRTTDEPQNWFMSRRDDPEDWDFVPFQPEETQAVAGNQSEAGLFPDILNSLIPYNEDILIFGGDKSIYQMSGDPAAGGRFDLITDKTGISFGRPWTKDPNGILYFLGSRGGLYRMVPGGVPERISLNRIERRLQDIDFDTYYARLEYNWRDEGIHILLIPYGGGGTQVSHYFYEIKTDSFWEDTFGTTSDTSIQPTSVVVYDGDAASDRVLFFGCEDGRVRSWDKDADSDDVYGIDSFVTITLPRTPGYETVYRGLTAILGHSEQGTTYSMHVGQNPDNIGGPVQAGKLLPGRNKTKWTGSRGSHGWLQLRNALTNQTWSVEEILLEVDPAGPARSRSDI